MCRQTVQKRGSAPPTTRFTRRSGCTRSRLDTSVSRRTLTAIAVRRLPLSPKTQKSTENRCFFHALTEIRCRQNFPFFLTGEAQHIDMPYLEVPVRFNMPIYAFLHNVLLVRKLNPHTKLQCSKTYTASVRRRNLCPDNAAAPTNASIPRVFYFQPLL